MTMRIDRGGGDGRIDKFPLPFSIMRMLTWLFKKFSGREADAQPTDQAPVQEPANKARPKLPSEPDLLQTVAAGDSIDLEAVAEQFDEDAGFELLWRLLEASAQHARVDVIDQLGEFDLNVAQQKRLILAAIDNVPGLGWTAASAVIACDFKTLSAELDEGNEDDVRVFDAFGSLLGALAEVTATTGPAGTVLDVPGAAEQFSSWASELKRFGARAEDVVTLGIAAELCGRGNHDEELAEARFNSQLGGHLRAIKEQVLAEDGREGPWAELLPRRVENGDLGDALVAMQAAAVANVAIRPALQARATANAADEQTWDLALAAGVDPAMLATLAPVATETLRYRRLGEAEYCSPASQVGCLKCGGGTAADDDEMMIPASLRDRLLPLVVLVKETPGEHGEFLQECLAAPDPSLRYHALSALLAWPNVDVPERTHELVVELADDSMPAVQNQAMELRRVLAG